MKILINAGPTRESIDPVRFISNRSTGKMGYALANAAGRAGHEVTLVSGPVCLPPPPGLAKLVNIVTAAEMADAMKRLFPQNKLAILCAAVADFRPRNCAAVKIKKQNGGFLLALEKTEDVALALGKMKKPGQLLAGFAAETGNVEANALKKLREKNFDWIAANPVGVPGSGFASETNMVKLYAADGAMTDLGFAPKTQLAESLIRIFTAGQTAEEEHG